MKTLAAIEGGLAGACLLTLIHQVVKKLDESDAPRIDLLGVEVINEFLDTVHAPKPADKQLYRLTMGGDIVSNTFYYSLAGLGGKKNSLFLGALLGTIAGTGAVLLPKQFGLHAEYSNRNTLTKILTISYYLAGGLTAAAVMKFLDKK